jgi:hypothetical protein
MHGFRIRRTVIGGCVRHISLHHSEGSRISRFDFAGPQHFSWPGATCSLKRREEAKNVRETSLFPSPCRLGCFGDQRSPKFLFSRDLSRCAPQKPGTMWALPVLSTWPTNFGSFIDALSFQFTRGLVFKLTENTFVGEYTFCACIC